MFRKQFYISRSVIYQPTYTFSLGLSNHETFFLLRINPSIKIPIYINVSLKQSFIKFPGFELKNVRNKVL